MPLAPGKNKKAIAKNIKTEMKSGKKQDQAIAISMSKASKSKPKKDEKKKK